ncbi:transposase [Halalkaliarchaeum desulfuricum]|uniref:Transposase n=1 Tax=Halalkaliarchaeum desulfuricum TaxID=2055893 RepID=A0A343TL61_9EURY|nr:transposase [Halalkaliarchaeum desulfuricum]AUX09833.1 transposase [Halalkaliarchaeum desulfuricum]
MSSRKAEVVINHEDSYSRDLGSNGSYSIDKTFSMKEDDGGEDDENDDEETVNSDASGHQSTQEAPETDPIDGGTVTLTHPTTDSHDLDERRYLNAQLAAYNHSANDRDTLTPEAFDAKLLQVADRALNSVGVTVPEAEVEPFYIYAYLLHEAWGMDSIPKLYEHLESRTQTLERLGVEPLPSIPTLYRRENTMRDGGLTELIAEAAKQAVHAVWREYPLPPEIAKCWGLDTEMTVSENWVSPSIRREAVRNWARILVGDATQHLTFNRIGEVEYELEQIIAAFAHSALQTVGLTNGSTTAAYLYDEDTVPSGHTVTELLRGDSAYANSLGKAEIEDQFDAVHSSVLERFDSHGLFGDGTVDIAGDTTDELWWGGKNPHTIGRAYPVNDSVPAWKYAVMATVNTDAPVCFGVNLVESKDQYAAAFKESLDRATRFIDINYALFDKEFYDGDIIETVYEHDCPGLIVKAQNYEKVKKELIGPTPDGQPNTEPDVDLTSATPNPNAFIVPKEQDPKPTTTQDAGNQQTLAQFTGAAHNVDNSLARDISSHIVYISYLSVTEHDAVDVADVYSDRWAIETLIRALKRGFLPESGSDDELVRIYIINIAAMFLNWRSLVNNAPSPRYKLPLTVTGQELLTAVRDIGFKQDLEVVGP